MFFPNKNGNFEHFKDVFESEYEKLKSQDGAFELMRAESGGTSRPLKLMLMPSNGYTITKKKEKVIRNKGSLFLVVRRGVPLERVLHLWHRETHKISPDHELRIVFVGEDGIDSGALSKAFLTTTVVAIAENFFFNGSPLHSTNVVQNRNFRACGEIVATILAQRGPLPCFF